MRTETETQQSRIPKRLDEIHQATAGMTSQDVRNFEQVLLGALSFTASSKEWESAIRIAKRAVPTQEPTPECEYCGESSTEPLVPVNDSDPSVGYHSTLNVCPKCQTEIRLMRERQS